MTARNDAGGSVTPGQAASPAGLRRLGPASNPAEELEVGSISGVFGVQGEVRLYLHHRDTALFTSWRDVVLVTADGQRFSARLRARPGAGRRVLGRVQGIDTREGAESLQKLRILVSTKALPAPAADEFYVWQLEGAEVFEGDARVGRLVTVHDTAGGDILEVRVSGARDPLFLPCTKAVVMSIDAQAKVVRLHPGALSAADDA